ncbi:MAG: hypothetical protein QXU52_02840 [Fervidicoccaceae archaeon]
MRLLVEIMPTRSRKKLEALLEAVAGRVDEVFVPDSPLGIPKASVLPIAAIAVERGLRVAISLRVIDYSWTGLVNQIYGAYLVGVSEILFLRGDRPPRGTIVGDVSPEEALSMLRSDPKLSGIRGGLTISLRRQPEDIEKRLRARADFYVVLRKNEEKLGVLRSSGALERGELLGYAIVITPENRGLVKSRLQTEDSVEAELLAEYLDKWKGLLDGMIVSLPALGPSEISRVLGRL